MRQFRLGIFGIVLVAIALAIGLTVRMPIARSACDPSYPTVCIAPPPPDLDCGDISYRNFPVRQPDPHRFDGDRDGIGCEML